MPSSGVASFNGSLELSRGDLGMGFMFHHNGGERGQHHADRMEAAMRGQGAAVDTAKVPPTGPAVYLGIGVQKFPPVPSLRDTEDDTLAWHGGEVAGDEHW